MINLGKNQNILWKEFAFLFLLMVPLFLLGAQNEEKKNKENEKPPAPKSKVQKGQQPQPQKQQPQFQRPQTQYQQPKPQPSYQQAKPQPQYQPPKPQYQPSGQQHQYQQPKQQYQQPGQQPQYQQPKLQPQFQRGQQPPSQSAKTLTLAQSQQQIQNLNRNRGAMGGINRNPLPQGQVAVHADGSRTIMAGGGRQFQVRPNGTVASVSLSGGRTATFRPDGRVASVQAGGMQINHGLLGERRIVTVRSDHSRVVSMGPQRGYVERPYLVRNGRSYVERTYMVNRVTYTRIYRTNYYRGVPYFAYVPPFYYHPRFYFWAYNPWPRPIYYRWAWYAAPPPWYAYYGPYFAPAPMYPSAAFWLTDFLISESLRAAYESGREAEANAAAQGYQQPPPEAYQPAQPESYQPAPPNAGEQGNTTQITPEMKQAIAEEVSRQLAAEQQGASTNPQQQAPASAEVPPAALDPAQRLFVVSSNLAVTTVEGQYCELTPGDIITRLDDTPDNNNMVRTSVSTSKGNDCRVGSTPVVGVNDLQEMHNQFREQTDSGLKSLADNSGKGGLPPAPDTGTSPGEVPPAPADPNVNSALQSQQQAADQTEAQIQQEAAQGAQN